MYHNFYFFFFFHGRETELKELEALYEKSGFKFAVVYGRRRVGKSSLIMKFISDGDKPNISYMATEQNNKQNLDGISAAIIKKYSAAKSYITSFSSWETAFDYVIEQAGKDKLVIFIDEFPYIANTNPGISSILQKYIDGRFQSTNIMLILCGSSMSFMENQVLGHESPLYGRRNMQFKVEPFDYFDSAEFFESWSNEDKAIAYAVTGGVPQYLNKLNVFNDIGEGIKNEFLKKNGSLYEEPRNLLMQELREPAVYNAIIRAIAEGASKLNEIATKSGEDGKKAGKYLTTLISLHIIKKEYPIFSAQERNGVYRLADNMFRFWYKFVLDNHINIESGMVEYVYQERVLPGLPDFMGHIFEDICMQYLIRQNKALKLPFVFDEIGRWWGNNPKEKKQEEIDIIAAAKNVAVFCECKWKASVGIDVYHDLKRKAELFPQITEKYFVIFAKGSFSDAIIRLVEKEKMVKLVSLEDIYKK